MTARVLLLDWPPAGAAMVAHALAYARAGCRVHPLRPRTKIPMLEAWNERATRDPDQIRAWWAETPDANVGLVGGNGLVVLDVDGRNGGHESFDRLMVEHELPASPIVATGSGDGLHFYFNDPSGRVRTSTGKLGPGIDVLSTDKNIVAPPSVHPNGRRYVWAPRSIRHGIPDLPASLIELLAPEPVERKPVPRSTRTPIGLPTPYGARALDGLIGDIATAPEGARHATLYRCAARAGDLVQGGHLDAAAAFDALVDAGQAALANDPKETASTIATCVHDGMRRQGKTA